MLNISSVVNRRYIMELHEYCLRVKAIVVKRTVHQHCQSQGRGLQYKELRRNCSSEWLTTYRGTGISQKISRFAASTTLRTPKPRIVTVSDVISARYPRYLKVINSDQW
jgi:hypothetical protein